MTSIHSLCVVARQEETCTVCQAPPGQPCDCTSGIHAARFDAAKRDGFITGTEFASALPGVFTAATVIPDAWCPICGVPLDATGAHIARSGARIPPEVTP
jgi:hypothetical protein